MDLTLSSARRRSIVAGAVAVAGLVVLVVGVATSDAAVTVIGAALAAWFALVGAVILRNQVRLDGSVVTSTQLTTARVDLARAVQVGVHRTPNGLVSLHVRGRGATARMPVYGKRSGNGWTAEQLEAVIAGLGRCPEGVADDAVEALRMQLAPVRDGVPLPETPFGQLATSTLTDAAIGTSAVAALLQLGR